MRKRQGKEEGKRGALAGRWLADGCRPAPPTVRKEKGKNRRKRERERENPAVQQTRFYTVQCSHCCAFPKSLIRLGRAEADGRRRHRRITLSLLGIFPLAYYSLSLLLVTFDFTTFAAVVLLIPCTAVPHLSHHHSPNHHLWNCHFLINPLFSTISTSTINFFVFVKSCATNVVAAAAAAAAALFSSVPVCRAFFSSSTALHLHLSPPHPFLSSSSSCPNKYQFQLSFQRCNRLRQNNNNTCTDHNA